MRFASIYFQNNYKSTYEYEYPAVNQKYLQILNLLGVRSDRKSVV